MTLKDKMKRFGSFKTLRYVTDRYNVKTPVNIEGKEIWLDLRKAGCRYIIADLGQIFIEYPDTDIQMSIQTKVIPVMECPDCSTVAYPQVKTNEDDPRKAIFFCPACAHIYTEDENEECRKYYG